MQYFRPSLSYHLSLRSLFCLFYTVLLYSILCIFFRLCDIYQTVEKAKPGVKFTDNAPPILGRGGKKGDIYQLVGCFLFLSHS